MKYESVELVGAGRIKSQNVVMNYEDDDDYVWSNFERERQLAKAISRKVGIPAKYLIMEFAKYTIDYDNGKEEKKEWVA